jgi:hypothetical protein
MPLLSSVHKLAAFGPTLLILQMQLVLDLVIKLGVHTVRVHSWNGLALPCRYPTESQISGSHLALSAAKREGHPKLQRPTEEVAYG